MSDLEDIDIMLGNYLGNDYVGNQYRRAIDIDLDSNGLQQNVEH